MNTESQKEVVSESIWRWDSFTRKEKEGYTIGDVVRDILEEKNVDPKVKYSTQVYEIIEEVERYFEEK